jgi:hypothetical protein
MVNNKTKIEEITKNAMSILSLKLIIDLNQSIEQLPKEKSAKTIAQAIIKYIKKCL